MKASDLPQGDWLFETINSNLVFGHIVKEKYFEGKSEFQEVQVLKLGSFGKCLMIDDHVQSSEMDEFIYHECLVQPVMHLHPNPKTVFIAGGGEGATAREILRHKTVEKVVMVDIDDIVVKVSKEHLPQHHAGSFEDPRMVLIQDDAKKYLEETTEKFDVIIMDLPDPIEEGPAFLLYTQKFYTMLKTRLNVGGLVITQSGPGGPTSYSECFTPIYTTLSSVFGAVRPYCYYIPSFGDCNGFNIAAVDDGSESVATVAKIPSPEFIDARIAERFGAESPFQFFDGVALQGLFSVPKFIRKALVDEKRIITEENPLVCFQD
eukprot:TRINITY_DN7939_c1_g1_i1.p1 TRINITY_DN7939_c1_g1~~TRINITY_DN7939_c1_g1_i1.p1  ORF type:complete len:330 (-),score=174.25 TRINITY_DN7939_c1_g1_i1:122-1081(-)